VVATTSDEVAAGVKFSTPRSIQGVLTVRFHSDNRTTVISISQARLVVTSDADRWRCTTLDNTGSDCSAEHPLELVTPEIVAYTINTIVIELRSEVHITLESGGQLNVEHLENVTGLGWHN
jgi:hypothetical protein